MMMMIRGVNVGGYLVLERYITPYLFVVTDCHVRYEFCWYPHQLSGPPITHPQYQPCQLVPPTTTTTTTTTDDDDDDNDSNHDHHHTYHNTSTTPTSTYCTPIKVRNAFGNMDYPIDERTLALAFLPPQNNSTNNSNSTIPITNEQRQHQIQQLQIAEEWIQYHLEYFISYHDLVRIKQANITHLRVPIPHWILYHLLNTDHTDNDNDEEIWITGPQRWKYFIRLCHWARELDLQIWPDLHTAPGSQNGFDNSGQALPYNTCQVWSNNPEYIDQTLQIIETIALAIQNDGLSDVVTGFGLLNEPYADCIQGHYQKFVQHGKNIVRTILGPDIAIYVSDMFQANIFNDGQWWIDPDAYSNTYLDSHYYQVFDSTTRYLSPRQHIAYTCRNHYARTISCCYSDGPYHHNHPSRGVSRMIGEWSASMDILPSARIGDVIAGIVNTGIAPYMDRQLSQERKEFLYNYIQAQIVSYEAASHPGVSSAWFYWTIKMEGGAFLEWDMLRGIQDGWFPTIVSDPNVSSESVYGSCYDIMWRTNDNRTNVLDEYPDPQYVPAETDPKKIIDDDVVLSHGESLLLLESPPHSSDRQPVKSETDHDFSTDDTLRGFHTLDVLPHRPPLIVQYWWLLLLLLMVLLVLIPIVTYVRKRWYHYQKRFQYSRIIESDTSMTI